MRTHLELGIGSRLVLRPRGGRVKVTIHLAGGDVLEWADLPAEDAWVTMD
ncbi:hypothetical protein MF406_14105 [Georgenia sp. TF02-10]|nr:hypothetical protein [Georgenia sp. TF02-10]UNX54066.1 hypothetical protein MF406_14105 [Georgenia sp. TF02-10]